MHMQVRSSNSEHVILYRRLDHAMLLHVQSLHRCFEKHRMSCFRSHAKTSPHIKHHNHLLRRSDYEYAALYTLHRNEAQAAQNQGLLHVRGHTMRNKKLTEMLTPYRRQDSPPASMPATATPIRETSRSSLPDALGRRYSL